jgi:tetratricopeptide (TPR) repeat protein
MSSGAAAGNSTLTVRITFEGSHRTAAGLHVELVSPLGGVADMRTTDGNGAASFENVSAGRYVLRISGPGIETTQSVAIDTGASEGGPNITMNIEVHPAKAVGAVNSSADTFYVPEAARLEFNLGAREVEKKNWEAAKVHFKKAIGLFPKYADAFNSLGSVEVQLYDGKAAVDAFRAATHLDPTLRQANLYLGQFYYENAQYKDAEPYLERASADQPNSAQLLTALANSELQNGKANLALANARRVPSLPNHKQFAVSHLIAAQALVGKGHDREIEKEYKTYLKEAPDSTLAPRVKDALAKLQSK